MTHGSVRSAAIRHTLVWLAALGYSIAPAYAQQENPDGVFSFAPPVGMELTRTVTVKRRVEVGPSSWKERFRRKEDVRIDPQPGGYAIVMTPVTVAGDVDGQRLSQRVQKALVGSPLSLDIDDSGRVTRVDGIEERLRRFRREAPTSLGNKLDVFCTAEGLIARQVAEWNRLVTGFVGGSATPGTTWTRKEPLYLSTGERLLLSTDIELTERRRCPGGRDTRCVRLEFHIELARQDEVGGDGYADIVELQVARAISHLDEPSDAPDGYYLLMGAEKMELASLTDSELSLQFALSGPVEFTGSGYVIVEPATMLVHRESWDRDIAIDYRTARERQHMTIDEQRRVDYRYD